MAKPLRREREVIARGDRSNPDSDSRLSSPVPHAWVRTGLVEDRDPRGEQPRWCSAVVRGVSFTVRRGELFGFLGTNGAGKTTTVETLQRLRRAVLRLDPAVAADRLRPGGPAPAPGRRLFASPHPTPRPLHELAEEWQLATLWRRPSPALSGGERRRLFVALAPVARRRPT